MIADEQGRAAPKPVGPSAKLPEPTEAGSGKPALALMKDLGSVILAATAALYASGFVIVNTYYGRLGVPATFVGARCIAGAVFPLGVVFFTLAIVWISTRSAEDPVDAITDGILAGGVTSTAIYVVTSLVWGFVRSPFSWSALPSVVFLVILIVGAAMERLRPFVPRARSAFWLFALFCAAPALDLCLRFFGLESLSLAPAMGIGLLPLGGFAGGILYGQRRRSQTPGTRGHVAAVGGAVLFAALLVLYGAFAYPTVPAALGGGVPVRLDATFTEFNLHGMTKTGVLPEECLKDTPSVYLIDMVGPYVLLTVRPQKGPARTLAIHQNQVTQMVFPVTPWMATPRPASKKRAVQPQTLAPYMQDSASTAGQEPR